MKKIFILIILLTLFPNIVNAKTNIYLFYGDGCPHCTKEKAYLNELSYSKDINIIPYEIWYNEENQKTYEKVKELLKIDNTYVPLTIIGSKSLVGFSENTKNEILTNIENCETNECIDVIDLINKGIEKIEKPKEDINDSNNEVEEEIKTIPFLGKVNIKNVSLPLISIIIGLVDGFNPCAMWILVFLISILITMKDKKKMILLGTTFLTTSAIIYFLFMASWLKLTISITSVIFIRNIIAIIALTFGLYNIIKVLKTKEVGCTVTSNQKRKKIMEKIKIFTSKKSLFLGFLCMIILAISVNFIELACSAGLPLLFTQILAINDISFNLSLLYMFIYILAYLFDDIIIFLIAVVTCKITGISNKYSKYSKLIGGFIMVIIGLLLLIKPEWIMFNF